MPISAADSITLAVEHTKQQLFKPFRIGQWTKLAFVGLLAGELGANGTVAADTQAKLIYGKVIWGYLTITIDSKNIRGQATEIDRTGKVSAGDSFSYPAAPVSLKNPKAVPTL